jgi:hypothetical protein
MCAAHLPVTLGGELRPDQIPEKTSGPGGQLAPVPPGPSRRVRKRLTSEDAASGPFRQWRRCAGLGALLQHHRSLTSSEMPVVLRLAKLGMA